MELNEAIELTEGLDLSEKMVLPNVKVCGLKSLNKREYPIHVLEKSLSLYENCPIYLDHSKSSENRRYTERIGQLTSATIKADGVYGTVRLNPYHTLSESIWYDFANNTRKLGLSQVVEAEVVNNVVQHIIDVKSVDLVCNPATVMSLREEVEVDEIALLKEEIKQLKLKIQEDKVNNDELQVKLLSEIESVKSMSGKRAVAIAPKLEIPQSESLVDWVNKITRKK